MPGRITIVLITIAILTGGCTKGGFTVSGLIDDAGEGEWLYLREVKPGYLEPVDSLKLKHDGRFRFRATTQWPSFYMLAVDDTDFLTLLVEPGQRIEVEASRYSMSAPLSVTGSEGSSLLQEFRRDHERVIAALSDLTELYNKNLNSADLPLLMDSLDKEAARLVDAFRERSLTLLEADKSSMVSLFLLNQHVVPGNQLFDPQQNPELYYSVDSALCAAYPGSELVLDLHTFVGGLRKSINLNRQSGSTPVPGEQIPEITLPDPQGDTIRLSSMRGKVVLVDFWAAWCPPCRTENSNLVKLYDIYHYRGFDIFQVSLDLRKDEWTDAIRDDRLGRWKHVSDLRYRDSEVVKQFGLTEIPASFLIDRKGNVVAVNLRGDELRKKLEELL